MSLSFTVLDWVIIAVYFIAIIWLSIRRHWQDMDEESYLLSGRRMTLPAFVATLVSTFYGGILGVGEYSYQFGISEWLLFGVPYYIFSLLFAYYLAGKIRNNPALSLPEAIANEYGSKAGGLSAIPVFILISPAPYILMLGLLLQFMIGGSGSVIFYAILISIFSIGYISLGGFDAVVRTDMLQMILMYVGFIFLLIFSIHYFGSPLKLWNSVPPVYRNLSGGHSIQFVFVWFFIALWTFVAPSFHQRSAAAESPKVAQKGIVISVLFWILFDFLTVTCGMYSFMILGHIDKAEMAYPYLADKILPMGLRGLFYVALLATIMSTMDSYLFLAGQTLGRDLLAKLFPQSRRVTVTRISVTLAAVIGILLIMVYPSVITLWYVIGSVMIPGLLVPVLGIYLPLFRLKRPYVLATIIISTTVSLIWLIIGTMHQTGEYSEAYLGIEPFYPGLALSFIFWLMGRDKKHGKTAYQKKFLKQD